MRCLRPIIGRFAGSTVQYVAEIYFNCFAIVVQYPWYCTTIAKQGYLPSFLHWSCNTGGELSLKTNENMRFNMAMRRKMILTGPITKDNQLSSWDEHLKQFLFTESLLLKRGQSATCTLDQVQNAMVSKYPISSAKGKNESNVYMSKEVTASAMVTTILPSTNRLFFLFDIGVLLCKQIVQFRGVVVRSWIEEGT